MSKSAEYYNKRGVEYYNKGDYSLAEECFLKAKYICEKKFGKKHPDYATSLDNLGILYHDMRNYARAEECYFEFKDIQEKVHGKEHPDYVLSLNNLGGLYSIKGDYACAEEFYLMVKYIYEKNFGKKHPDYAALLNNLGKLYCDKEDYDHAKECYFESNAIMEKNPGKDHPDYAILLSNLGALYFGKKDYAFAEEYYLKAKDIYEKVLGKDHPNFANSLESLFLLYMSMNEYKKALAYIEEANRLKTSLVNRIFTFLSGREREKYWNVNSLFLKASYLLSGYYPVPESNILNYNNTLFIKGLLLRTVNAVKDSIYSSGDKKLIAQYDEFNRLRRQIGNLRQKGDGNEVYIKSLENQAEKMDKSLTKASVAFREFNAELSLNWQDVRDSLKTGEAAIEFISFIPPIYAALVLRSNMDAPEYIHLPDCEEKLLEFLKKQNEKTQEKEKNVYDEYGSELYAAIWQPLEKILEGVTSVYYSPSGLLHKISFNTIPVKEGLRLIDIYDLNLVSSTSEIVRWGNKTTQKPYSGVVYGGLQYTVDEDIMKREAQPYNTSDAETKRKKDLPDILRKSNTLHQRWEKLIYSEKEGRDIQKILSENNIPVDLYMNTEGNKESFLYLDGKKKSVIHLATHGFFFGNIEKNYNEQHLLELLGVGPKVFENLLLRSGLVLSGGNNAWEGKTVAGVENGILFADDVANMDLVGAQLVVLSACETALGEVNNSEGVFGLQRAFKLAGAETLIMSLWNVSDRATSELMSSFYKKWLSGNSKQEAFKEAQRQLRAKPEYSSPFYWAAFVMID